ncbi:MAG: type secretion system protein TrbF [Pseudomonadota bacterium]|nr:type secretion system protein TrbF [Pseudomonadota bacterium]
MKDIENPYFDSRKDWNEIIGKEKANTSMWRMFALLELIPMVVAICGMIYASQLPDVVPFIFKEDASGGITALGIPNQELKVDNRMVANQLALFIVTLRQLPSSLEIRKSYVSRVKMMSSATLFQNVLAPMLREEYTAIGTGNQNIKVTTILPVNKDTWQIDWIEYKNGTETGKYKATVNYIRSPAKYKDPNELIWNPLSIVIKDININRVIAS